MDELIKQMIAEAVAIAVEPLWAKIRALEAELPIVWVDQQEAERLTGRSYAWFYHHRTNGTLPIRMLPRTAGSRRLRYCRASCIAYGRNNSFLPPAGLA